MLECNLSSMKMFKKPMFKKFVFRFANNNHLEQAKYTEYALARTCHELNIQFLCVNTL